MCGRLLDIWRSDMTFGHLIVGTFPLLTYIEAKTVPGVGGQSKFKNKELKVKRMD